MDTVETPVDGPCIATICGDAGMGKTSLAATFPKPIFIRAENGMQAITKDKRPDAFPVLTGVPDLWQQLTALLAEDHDYKTLAIDSVTALERMFVEHVLKNDTSNPRSINQALGGYGAGAAAVTAMHQRVRKAAGLLADRKGMNIVFIAHADVETMRMPDVEDYNRYSLRLPSKSMPPYVDDVDLVGFLRLQMFVKGEDKERKKAISTGARELITYPTAANVSKNRYGITDALDVGEGENPLIGRVPFLGPMNAKTEPKPATKAATAETKASNTAKEGAV